MATMTEAREAAQKRATETGEATYVVYDTEGATLRQSHAYHAITEYDLSTFYADIRDEEIIEVIEP